ncbi:FxsA family protein [Thermopetrobacter sp. TC1]|uniref:FxsA family protein n=1 Tax=Thermopetrobacter sp. TC1 TaxID=1495045 RepID=UPI00068D246B|nr:FxsA family protein [Thermopetrobacter sp. TC1]
MIFLILLLLFVGIPAIEIATFIKVGAKIGVFNTVFFTFFTAVLGVILVRWQSFSALQEFQQAAREGRTPALEIISGALLVLAGILLLIPGFVTDAIGFLLLVPPVRKFVAGLILQRLAEKAEVYVWKSPSATVIEAEVVDIEEEPDIIESPRRRDHGGRDADTPWRPPRR